MVRTLLFIEDLGGLRVRITYGVHTVIVQLEALIRPEYTDLIVSKDDIQEIVEKLYVPLGYRDEVAKEIEVAFNKILEKYKNQKDKS